jgi:hypothetical protein
MTGQIKGRISPSLRMFEMTGKTDVRDDREIQQPHQNFRYGIGKGKQKVKISARIFSPLII